MGAIAARVLALVLAVMLVLSVAGPGAGLAADLAFHAGGADHGRSVVETAGAAGTAVDPGVSEHLHCGCHQAAPLEDAVLAPPVVPGRPVAVRISRALPSIIPECLPRPPRA